MAGAILVVGANGGMGMAVTRALLDASHAVHATVSRVEAVQTFVDEHPGCLEVTHLNLADAGMVKQRLAEVVCRMDRLDAVVVCAAVAPFAPAETETLSKFRDTMEINCVSNLAVYQACLPALRRSRGRLVLTGSWSGKVATPMMASYVASKFALEGLADVIRQEAGAWGVDVVLVQPGALDTQMMRRSQASLAGVIANLEGDEATLYGDLYRQMKYRADEGMEKGNYTSPVVAAAAVMEALSAATPQTRYAVGSDAEFMLEMAKTRTDREIDGFILDMYRLAPLAANAGSLPSASD